jgi:glycosyltransferase involved in cell wall biosynthesis
VSTVAALAAPDPYRAPVKVVDLDLARGVGEIACPGYDRVIVFARYGSRPLGHVVFEDVVGGLVDEARLRERLYVRLGLRLAKGMLAVGAALPRDGVAAPPISVVVCTRDRAELLADCLAHLQALDYPHYEVVVVDNASATGATAEVAARHPVRYVREERPGLNWARNRGVAEARHDIVAFTDDDARADSAWLTAVARGFADPQVGCVTGLIAPAELETRAQILFDWAYGGMGKGTRARTHRAARMSARERIAVFRLGVGTNMAFRRAALERAGPFDTALDVGTPSCGGGDLDMMHRIVGAGFDVRYEPGALVWHRHRRELSALRKQLESDGRAFGVYLIKLWRTRSVERRAIWSFVARQWAPWLVGRVLRGLVGREQLPLALLWANLRGALLAPWSYTATYRNDARLRRLHEPNAQRARADVT